MSKTLPKFVAVLAASSLVLAACSTDDSDDASDTAVSTTTVDDVAVVSVEDNHGTVEIETPVESVIATDNRTFELLDDWGVNVVAAPQPLVPATVPGIKDNADIVDLGNHREPDLEATVAADADLIIVGQRFSQYYDDIKDLNPDTPIIELEPREGEPLADELIRQVEILGEIFDREDEAQELVDNFNAAIDRAKEAYNNSDTVMAVNVSGGEIGYIAPGEGRTFGPIFDLLELNPALEIDNSSDNHTGDDISVEAIADANPDWIFVLDRDAAVDSAEEGYTPALDVIAGAAALANVTAIVEGHLVLAPADTYTNEGIQTYTEILDLIADAFEGADNGDVDADDADGADAGSEEEAVENE